MKKYANEQLAPSVVTGREEKTVGIEIEFFGVNYRTVVASLKQAGINVQWEGYTHQVTSGWKLVYDASVTSTGTGLNKGLELVSPPLTVEAMRSQLKVITTVLNQLGAKVDKTCGVHVHHDVNDYTFADFKNLFVAYDKHSQHIDEIMPMTRRRAYQLNAWTGYCEPISETELEAIKNAESIQDITQIMRQRYRVLNFTSFVKYGTIEFRQHAGSTDFDKLMNWIMITQKMVATSKIKKAIKPMSETGKKRQTEAFFTEFGLEFTKEGLYTRDRKDELKRKLAKAV
jgi:hypothetical protein